MFGDTIDNHITMLQRVVALMRDLVIAVVAGLTALIVAYSGNPSTLDALDWTRLVGAAFLIVVGPVFAFFVVKILLNIIYGISLEPISKLPEQDRDASELHETQEVRGVVLPANQ
jgi:hypothetical protein